MRRGPEGLPQIAQRYGQRERPWWLMPIQRAVQKAFPMVLPQIAQRYPEQPPARKGWRKRNMLLLKPKSGLRKAMMIGPGDEALARAMGDLAPPERKALGQIVETAELADIEGMGLALVIPTTPELLDHLAQVGEQFADLERSGDDEDGADAEDTNEDGVPSGNEDDEPDFDNEATAAGFPNPTF